MPTELDTLEPVMIEEDPFGNVPWHAVLAPEGVPSGDGRMFSAEALTSRILPLPLRWIPTDIGGHDGAVTVGRIDRVWREGNLYFAEGIFDVTEEAYEVVRRIAEGMERGISVDVDRVTAVELSEGMEDNGVMEYASARVAGATVCPIPAFEEAYIALGPYQGQDNMVPGTAEEGSYTGVTDAFERVPAKTMDGPGWITDPQPTKRITSYWVTGEGAAKIAWGAPGDFNRCRLQLAKYVQNPQWLAGLCANLHYRALGTWPGRHAATTEDMAGAVTASALSLVDIEEPLPAEWFTEPVMDQPQAIVLEDDGRTYGYLALWDGCHIGYADMCVSPPRSMTSYSHFKLHHQLTTEGLIPTGVLSIGGGHADPRLGIVAATAHYDSTSTAFADVTVGENETGIWFSGALRKESLTPARLREIRGASLSGDWRAKMLPDGTTNLELVAALAVNVPGFPIVRATLAMEGTRQLSLVAAGAFTPEDVTPEPEAEPEVEPEVEPETEAEPEPEMVEETEPPAEEQRHEDDQEPEEPEAEAQEEAEPEVDPEVLERAKTARQKLLAARIRTRAQQIAKGA